MIVLVLVFIPNFVFIIILIFVFFCVSPLSCSVLKQLTFMWGGRESITWKVTLYGDDELEHDVDDDEDDEVDVVDNDELEHDDDHSEVDDQEEYCGS